MARDPGYAPPPDLPELIPVLVFTLLAALLISALQAISPHPGADTTEPPRRAEPDETDDEDRAVVAHAHTTKH